MIRVPTLTGPRLRLEPLSPAHSPGMFELWRQPEVCAHSGPAVDSAGRAIDLPAESVAASDRLLAYWLDRAGAGSGFRFAVVTHAASEFVGAVGFNAVGACAEYAYHLTPRHWGRGLAREASRLALEWVFASGSETVEAFIQVENVRSIGLAMRLGFRPGGPASAEGLARWVLARTDFA